MKRASGNLPRGTKVLITGGTGTLGSVLTKTFLERGFTVSAISRDAHKQARYRNMYPDVRYTLADICDARAVAEAVRGQDIVIHAAALKRVDIGEQAVREYVRVNVSGTQVVADAVTEAQVPYCLMISTDKAVMPVNLYGMTKATAERVWLAHNSDSSSFSVVRYGNVMGSNGSVIPIWREQVKDGRAITVRTPQCTRFAMLSQDAVELVENAIWYMEGGEVFVPGNVPAFTINDLAQEFQPEERWQLEPLGPGEKQDEILVAPSEKLEHIVDDLWCIRLDAWGDGSTPEQFSSERTSNRLTGKEVLAMLGETSEEKHVCNSRDRH